MIYDDHRLFIQFNTILELNNTSMITLNPHQNSQSKSTTFLWLSLSLSIYLWVVWSDAWPAIIWMSLSEPPTNDIFFEVSVMKVLRPLWDEQPIRPNLLYQPWNIFTIVCEVVNGDPFFLNQMRFPFSLPFLIV